MTTINIAKERSSEEIVRTLHPFVREWFFSRFKDFSQPQKYGVMAIWERKNILISAPTGGTKTLTAFLSILNYLVIQADEGKLENRIYALYCSPLKALSNDIHKNLIEPLEEINRIALSHGKKLQEIRVGLRTGDTTTSERAKMARKAPHIMITTPESMAIILTSKKFVEYMRMMEFCIVDEIHAMSNKRGVFLSLSLERLNEVSAVFPVKIGLSATVEPLEEVARFLVGEADDREVDIAKVKMDKKIDVKVLSPVENLMDDLDANHKMYDLINELIKEHKTTLIFTNTRSATERIVSFLKDKFPTEYGEDNIAAHHSSLSKEFRFDIEERLRDGKLKVVVCSTSLELGLDIGYIDLVIMLGSPKASSRALQRLGRAGHKLHDTAKGRFIVTDRDDLVECAVIEKEMLEGKIDKVQIPKNCLDVLAQHIFGMAIYKIWKIDELFDTIKKSHCYKELKRNDFLDVISYLSGEYSLESNYVFAKIWYDKTTGEIGKKGKLARMIYLTNLGTIPGESFITVKLAPSGNRLGAIDEGFMERMKKGDVFVLGGSKYVYLYTRGMNLYVHSALNRNPTIPSWVSEMLPLSFDSAMEINRFRKLMREKFERKIKKDEILEFIKKHLYLEGNEAEQIYEYFYEQFKISEIPHENLITIERYHGEKNYLLVNCMYGRRVNDALSRALGFLIGRAGGRDIELGISDRGFYIAGEKLQFEKALAFLNEKNLQEVLEEAIEKTDILTRRFRHCASRSLMILRTYKGQERSVGKQQVKSHFLLAAVKKVSKNFPILREARREVLEDLMDMEHTKQVLAWIKDGKIKTKIIETRIPSPFALNLILQGHMDLIKIEDRQSFLKRMHKIYRNEIDMREK